MLIFLVLILGYIINFNKINTNKHEDYNYIGLNIYKLCSLFLNFKHNILFYDFMHNPFSSKNLYKVSFVPDNIYISYSSKRVLLISNHVNYSDFINIQNFISKYYIEYNPIYIFFSQIKIPIYGNKMKVHHIIYNDINSLEDRCKQIYSMSINEDKKYILVIFPEKNIRDNYNITKYRELCKINNKKYFTNLIEPDINLVVSIFNNFKPERIILTTLVYSDDIMNNKSKSLYDVFNTNIAKYCHTYVSDISLYIELMLHKSTDFQKSFFYYIWQKQDTLINNIYKYHIYKKYIWQNDTQNIFLYIFYLFITFILYMYYAF